MCLSLCFYLFAFMCLSLCISISLFLLVCNSESLFVSSFCSFCPLSVYPSHLYVFTSLCLSLSFYCFYLFAFMCLSLCISISVSMSLLVCNSESLCLSHLFVHSVYPSLSPLLILSTARSNKRRTLDRKKVLRPSPIPLSAFLPLNWR